MEFVLFLGTNLVLYNIEPNASKISFDIFRGKIRRQKGGLLTAQSARPSIVAHTLKKKKVLMCYRHSINPTVTIPLHPPITNWFDGQPRLTELVYFKYILDNCLSPESFDNQCLCCHKHSLIYGLCLWHAHE